MTGGDYRVVIEAGCSEWSDILRPRSAWCGRAAPRYREPERDSTRSFSASFHGSGF